MTLLPKAPGWKLRDVAINAEMISSSLESNCQAPPPLPTRPGGSAMGRSLGSLVPEGQEVPLFALGVPEADLRRAHSGLGRPVRAQDGTPARDSTTGRLCTGRRGWYEIALAPRDDGERLYPAALRAELARAHVSTTLCRRDRRLGVPTRSPLRDHDRGSGPPRGDRPSGRSGDRSGKSLARTPSTDTHHSEGPRRRLRRGRYQRRSAGYAGRRSLAPDAQPGRRSGGVPAAQEKGAA